VKNQGCFPKKYLLEKYQWLEILFPILVTSVTKDKKRRYPNKISVPK